MGKRPRFYVPENFNVESFLDEFQVTRNRNRDRDIYHYIIGSITKQRACHRCDEWTDGDLFVPRLKAQYLKNVIGSKYPKYREALELHGIITCSHSSISGESCMEVDLAEPYRYQPRKAVEISNLELLNQYRGFVNDRRKATRKALGEHKPLMQWMNPKDLRIDEEAAVRWIERYQDILVEKIRSSSATKQLKGQLLKTTVETSKNYFTLIEAFNHGDYGSPHFDPFGHRWHSPLTNMKSELRHFLTYRGSTLRSVDVKNSQPYFLLPLLQQFRLNTLTEKERTNLRGWINYGPQTKEEGKKERNTRPKNALKESIILPDYAGTFACTAFQQIEIDPFFQFRQLVANGELYEEMAKVLGGRFFKNGTYDRFGSRDQVKKGLLWLMYHDPVDRERHINARWNYYEPVMVFKQHFPEVFAGMERLKQDDYLYLPKQLQRLESFVMLHQVFFRLSGEFPRMPLFPIHDCVVTTEEYHREAVTAIQEECEKVVGVPPNVAIKPLVPFGAGRSLVKLRRTHPDVVVEELKEKRRRNKQNTLKRSRRRERLG